jgi:hypothetical protein
MSVQACPSCTESLAAEATTCPSCGASIARIEGVPAVAFSIKVEITHEPVEAKAVRPTGPPLDTVLTPHLPVLQAMGWHVKASAAEIGLHRFFKNGKVRKGAELYLLDRSGEPDTPAQYPYYLRAPDYVRARTFRSVDIAIESLLIEARRLAPKKPATPTEPPVAGSLSLREILTNAAAVRESVRIIYHGGRHPGAWREIVPLVVTESAVRALDPGEGVEKSFVLNRIELPTSSSEAPAYAPPPRTGTEWFYMTVIGESHYQHAIRDYARLGQTLDLRYEIDELTSTESMFVYLPNGEPIGSLDFDRARQMREDLRSGHRYVAMLHRVTGGTPEKPSLGIVLRVVKGYPGVNDDEFRRAIETARTAPDELPSQDRASGRPQAAPPAQSLSKPSQTTKTTAAGVPSSRFKTRDEYERWKAQRLHNLNQA